MSVRVELIREAVEDLKRYVEAGNVALFLRKLIRLEEVGRDTGLPLSRDLSGWRKIVVGDRNWRIIFTMEHNDTVARVWVIGDRDDADCYRQAQRRIRAIGSSNPDAISLAATMFQLSQLQKAGRKTKRHKQ